MHHSCLVSSIEFTQVYVTRTTTCLKFFPRYSIPFFRFSLLTKNNWKVQIFGYNLVRSREPGSRYTNDVYQYNSSKCKEECCALSSTILFRFALFFVFLILDASPVRATDPPLISKCTNAFKIASFGGVRIDAITMT